MEIPKQYLKWVGDKGASLRQCDNRIKELVSTLQSTIKIVNYLDKALKKHKHTNDCLSHGVVSGANICIDSCKDSWRKAREQGN